MIALVSLHGAIGFLLSDRYRVGMLLLASALASAEVVVLTIATGMSGGSALLTFTALLTPLHVGYLLPGIFVAMRAATE